MCMNGTHRKSFPETSSLYEWRVIYGKEQTNTAWYTNSNSIIHDTDTQFPSHTHTNTHTGMLIKLDSSPQKIEFCHELPTLTSSQTQRFHIDLWREFTREPWRIRVVSLRTIFVTKMSADWQREGLLRLFVCSRQKKQKIKRPLSCRMRRGSLVNECRRSMRKWRCFVEKKKNTSFE